MKPEENFIPLQRAKKEEAPVELYENESSPTYELGFCPYCQKATHFVSSFSPKGFWICTNGCMFRTSKLQKIDESIEDNIVQRKFEQANESLRGYIRGLRDGFL